MAVQIYTDGSCLGNPGPGGWAALVKSDKQVFKIKGGTKDTTNNRMELTAVIWGIKTAMVKFPDVEDYEIYSDSSWVINTMSKGWKRKMNLDLWAELKPFLQGKKIAWNWVRGHNGHPENEACDKLAFAEAQKQSRLR